MAASAEYDPDNLTNSDVEKLLNEGKLTPIVNAKAQGGTWDNITLVGYEKDNKTVTLEAWSACKHCKKAFRTHSKKDTNGRRKNFGLSSQSRHVQDCSAKIDKQARSSQQQKLSSFAYVKKNLSHNFAQKLMLAEVEFVVSGMHSFAAVEDRGLLSLAQTLISIGVNNGNVEVQDVWYGRKTIQEYTVMQLREYWNKVRTLIAEPIQRGHVACTTDLWTDDMIKRTYLDFTVFWIDSTWELRHSMMRCKVFEEDRKTGENIKKELEECFEQFGLVTGDTAITTDAGKYTRHHHYKIFAFC